MKQKSIFRTSLPELIQKNKFFQCFTCLQQFDSNHKYPMEVCEKQHFMCQECVKSKVFKKNSKNPNQYLCSLCQQIIDEKSIRRSSFLLQIKQFITKLMQREETRKINYKQVIQKLTELNKQILAQNCLKDLKIKQLEKELKQQQEVTNMLLQQIQQAQVLKQLKPTTTPLKNQKQQVSSTSKINTKLDKKTSQTTITNIKNSDNTPQYIKQMLQQISALKQQLENNKQQFQPQLTKQLSIAKKNSYDKQSSFDRQEGNQENNQEENIYPDL